MCLLFAASKNEKRDEIGHYYFIDLYVLDHYEIEPFYLSTIR